MATLYITEFARQARDAAGYGIVVPEEPMLADQTVTIGGASAQSNAFNASTTMVRIHTDAICSVALNANPTATAVMRRLAANTTEYFAVPMGKSYKIACISNT